MSQIELLVVVSICGILIALLLVAVQRVRGTAVRVSCASNLRQLSLAAHMYNDTHHHLPVGCAYPKVPGKVDLYYPGVSWHTSILPYMEQAELSVRAQAAYANDPHGRFDSLHDSLLRTLVPSYLCPAESRRMGGYASTPELVWANTSYMGVAGSSRYLEDGVFHPGLTVRLLDITDGTTSTVMIGERPPGLDGVASGWYSLEGSTICKLSQVLPADDATNFSSGKNCQYPPTPQPLRPGHPTDGCHLAHFWSLHPGGAHFAFADGSVRFLSYEVGPVLIALATRADGEVVPPMQ
jgi:prepilin-type processing-associated H-X9-DG protein